MIVLDADSIMSGATVCRLARMLQVNPSAGIIQAVSQPANQETAFARMLQFGAHLYADIHCAGRSFWQLDAGD